MPRDLRGGSRLLSIVALLVAIGGLVLAATALPMLTAEAPAGGSLEDNADADAGEEAIERTDPETAGAAGSAAAGAASGEAGSAAAGADPDEQTIEEIRAGIDDSDAGTALLGVAAVFATVGGAGEELPADAIDEEDVEGMEGVEGYPTGEAQERERESDLGVPPALGSLGGELGDLAAESAPEGEGGERPPADAEGLDDLEDLEGEGATEPGEEPGIEEGGPGSETGDTGAGSADGIGSGLLGVIPGGGTTVAAAFAALLALAFGLALSGGTDARSIPSLFVSTVLGAVVEISRGVERAIAALRARSIGELPAALAGALATALGAIRTRLGGGGGREPSESPVVHSGATAEGEEYSAARGRIREAFSAVVAASSLSRTRARTATPGEVARRAVEGGTPREPVAMITDAFRDVEYGGDDAEERVERVSEASEALSDRSQRGEAE